MSVTYDFNRLSPRYKRLANDHIKLDETCGRSNKITYEILHRLGSQPPEKYRIIYKVKSIVGIHDRTKMPIYGNEHRVNIELPEGYPGPTGDPICYMDSEIWHPNIRWSGKYKGRICITAKALGAWHSLDMLVIRIGEMLQWKNYLAENIEPYPEDEHVAQWVREVAEPKGIVNLKKGIVVDDSELLLPEPGFTGGRAPLEKPPRPKIKIFRRSHPSQANEPKDKVRPVIKITKKD